VFDVLFESASETLLELGRDPKWLGAELGVTAVLHTWTRELALHPHVHCIVTGGGLTEDGSKWKSAKKHFFFPVHVMGALFRKKVIAKLRRRRARLDLGPAPVDPEAFDRLMARLQRVRWVVYAKRPFGGAEQVVRYLGRYTHRIGISNARLVSLHDGLVTFHTKDGKRCTLPALDFLTRFVQHVLPPGFVKIRHYGLVSPAHAKTRLEVARRRLEDKRPAPAPQDCANEPANIDVSWRELLALLTGIDVRLCRACGALAVVPRPLDPPARAPPEAA
jgi:hypothetical protein